MMGNTGQDQGTNERIRTRKWLTRQGDTQSFASGGQRELSGRSSILAVSAIAAVGAATDTERWFQLHVTQDIKKGQTCAVPVPDEVFLGSVSLSPYKVARRRPHPEQETAPDAPRPKSPGLFGEGL